MARPFWTHDFSVKFPCHDCPDRHTACWSECEKYKKAKEEHAEKANHIRREKEKEKDILAARRNKAPWNNNRSKLTANDKQW